MIVQEVSSSLVVGRDQGSKHAGVVDLCLWSHTHIVHHRFGWLLHGLVLRCLSQALIRSRFFLNIFQRFQFLMLIRVLIIDGLLTAFPLGGSGVRRGLNRLVRHCR